MYKILNHCAISLSNAGCECALVLVPEALDLVVPFRRYDEHTLLSGLVEERVAAPRKAEHQRVVGLRVELRVELPALLRHSPPLALPELQLVHQRHRQHVRAMLLAHVRNTSMYVYEYCSRTGTCEFR